jgi:hydroxypyruvate reductase 1
MPQDWSAELFGALKAAGGRAYSNYAVGYNNVVVPEATKIGIPVGNTPGAHDQVSNRLPHGIWLHKELSALHLAFTCALLQFLLM